MSNYLYNDVELPALPKWDKETYPYAIISQGIGASLFVSKEPFTYGKFGAYGNMFILPAGRMLSTYDYSRWSDFSTQTAQQGTSSVSWSNHDIINTIDGSVYLPASYPIDAETGEEIHDYEIGNTETPTPIPADFYIKKGGKVYKVSGGGGSNFIFANSKEELPDPSTVPENTVGLVPSDGTGGGGLPVVELTTVLSAEISQLTETESAQMEAVAEKDTPITVKFSSDGVIHNVLLNKMSVALEVGTAVVYSAYLLVDYTPYILSLIYEGAWFGEFMPASEVQND